ncbi:hypothetical protein J6590_003252 [Homalodisca vitripennis]|nr:hypothetical protein J6590_003252 [Homalodisca vitripennis]
MHAANFHSTYHEQKLPPTREKRPKLTMLIQHSPLFIFSPPLLFLMGKMYKLSLMARSLTTKSPITRQLSRKNHTSRHFAVGRLAMSSFTMRFLAIRIPRCGTPWKIPFRKKEKDQARLPIKRGQLLTINFTLEPDPNSLVHGNCLWRQSSVYYPLRCTSLPLLSPCLAYYPIKTNHRHCTVSTLLLNSSHTPLDHKDGQNKKKMPKIESVFQHKNKVGIVLRGDPKKVGNEESQNELFASFQHQRHLDHKIKCNLDEETPLFTCTIECTGF